MKGLAISIFTAAALVIGVGAPSQSAEAGKVDLDQLRRENLNKDALESDELRRENLEKTDGKVNFDQLRRENLDKAAAVDILQ